MTLAKATKAIMKRQKVSQDSIARHYGASQAAISNLLNRPDSTRMQKFVEILDLMGYELVVRQKRAGRKEEGSIVISYDEPLSGKTDDSADDSWYSTKRG